MEKLNLPGIEPRLRSGQDGKTEIFDGVRRRYVRLTPEEWVRQHFLHFMIHSLDYPLSLIRVEAEITVNRMKRRFDIVACRPDGSPLMVVECKSPAVEISQEVFDQAARYNMTLKAPCLVVTNGLAHYACRVDHAGASWSFLQTVPPYVEAIGFPAVNR